MLWVNSAAGFIVCRGAIGIGLATFVTSQVWCTQMHMWTLAVAPNPNPYPP